MTQIGGLMHFHQGFTERVLDGDTYQLRLDLDFHVAISITGRLHGVDCPEMSTPEGRAAKIFVEDLLLPRDKPPPGLVVQSYKDQMSFARWVVDIWLPKDDLNLTELIIKAGHVKPQTDK